MVNSLKSTAYHETTNPKVPFVSENGIKKCHFGEVISMRQSNVKGFSLVELLIVVVVIGIVAAMAVPALRKSIWAAQNGNTVATMRTIASTQAGFFTQRERFGRLDEINPLIGNALGTVAVNEATKNQYVFRMVPAIPTDPQLREGFTVTATRNADGVIYQYEVTESGMLRQVLP
jgi:prepilin-type N-terminal cleavage/methylation domain-containing protein